jgi:hypothetical protein
MKATLEFRLPEENHEFANATQGSKMRSVLWELDQWLRAKLKFDELSDGQYDSYKATRDQLRELLQEENIDLDQ